MGMDFDCGCRISVGHYFLCPFHKLMVDRDLDNIQHDSDYFHYVLMKNKEIYRERK